MSDRFTYESTADNFRITDTTTDDRVATCYDEENVRAVTRRLNNSCRVAKLERIVDLAVLLRENDIERMTDWLLIEGWKYSEGDGFWRHPKICDGEKAFRVETAFEMLLDEAIEARHAGV